MMRTKLSFGIGIVAVLTIALLVWQYLYPVPAPVPRSTAGSPFAALMRDNALFAEAEALLRAGKPELALPKFRAAFPYARNAQEEGQIAFKIAASVMVSNGGSYRAAVPLFKRIATNESYSPITRASAVQKLAAMFFLTSNAMITRDVFKDEPYSSLRDKSNRFVSYRNLLEYASSIHPLASSELGSAEWYARAILRSAHASSTSKWKLTDEDVEIYKGIVRQKIANADEDIARMQNDPNESATLPSVLLRRATVIGLLERGGEMSFGTTDEAFKIALSSFLPSPDGSPQDGIARFYYAYFLAAIYGPTRYEDAIKILAPLYESDAYMSTDVVPLFRRERTLATSNHLYLVTLSRIDPKFKEFLASLGWTEDDF
ncbi:hypothetical protein A3A39_03490 [Candidatus Kaiserbacteria bacterium RIFCSPLOWO2_01_FULL_54_13]|uniref:Uncharacterized protein n=1 Tax=Candidatus Kaiserbacteria bacterium RIFCSPLOWO2_01_FULL_54_13 TaxID=1798512 RepID=A0A1F6F376_9BACT|nr:MAG: hypothetical protein A3A39_03490 [Candidatus Kaiserbacteria bacterium RIFCSPLOWO2_01_FULL_54_13]